MLNLFANSLITMSAVILMGSFITVSYLIDRLPRGPVRRGWYLMAVLTMLFTIVYLGYAILFWSHPLAWTDMIVPGMFFIGACFLWLAFNLSIQVAIDVRRVTLLEHENITDFLTSMYNRRFLDRRLREEYARFERYKAPLSVILLDIDHFKEINDHYGHQVGDLALNYVAKVIRKTIRTTDVAARYGGDEFLIITPNIHVGTAGVLAERIRQKVEAEPFTMIDRSGRPRGIPMTISAGVVGCDPNAGGLPQLVQRVDEALYAAKQAGRNRVIVGDAKG